MKILSLFDSPPQLTTVDTALSLVSENPVQNKVVAEALSHTMINPTGMEVGQVMRVTAVDENGMPTKWEGVEVLNSVNGQTGDAELRAQDVGALPDTVVVLHPQIIVTAETGSRITLNDGFSTWEVAENNGVWEFDISNYGTYYIYGELNDKTETIELKVSEVKQYEVHVTYLMPTFADNTWEQIIWACENDCVPETWNVGDIKPMTVNEMDYNIVIIDKYHDEYAAGGTAPLTLMFDQVYATSSKWNVLVGTSSAVSYINSGNWNGWATSYIRGILLPSIAELMPEAVRRGLKYVKKLSASNASTGTIVTTEDKLFLLAAAEVSDTDTYSFAGEGELYAYFETTANRIRYTTDGTTKRACHTRSIPNNSIVDLYRWTIVNTSGATTVADVNAAQYVAPVFCF